MIRVKKFENYKHYVVVQGGKISFKLDQIKSANPERIAGFEKLFNKFKDYLNSGSMLCLGARTGCEITAAENVGFDSTGIDLHPVGDNVIGADWHDMPFIDNQFDNVFTNSIDHCLDLDKLIAEIKRILKPDGKFFLMFMHRQSLETYDGPPQERMWSRPYDALFWDTEDDLVNEFTSKDFTITHSDSDNKWRYLVLKNQS